MHPRTLLILCHIVLSLSQTKTRYVIGGYLSGNPSQLLRLWKPILTDYLAVTVGSSYQPPIEFELVPVDYTANTSSMQLADNGQLDFICDLRICSRIG